ncbi:MAG: hypothetical protein WA761_04060 [Thermoplasmata archaeon]
MTEALVRPWATPFGAGGVRRCLISGVAILFLLGTAGLLIAPPAKGIASTNRTIEAVNPAGSAPSPPAAPSSGANSTLVAAVALISVGAALLMMTIGVPYWNYKQEERRKVRSVPSITTTSSADRQLRSGRAEGAIPPTAGRPALSGPSGPGTKPLWAEGGVGRRDRLEP